MVEHLTALPVDMTAAIATGPTWWLVAAGRAYEPSDLDEARPAATSTTDGNAIRPMADLRLHLAEMAAWPPWDGTRDWLEANELFRNEVLDILDADGPLLSRDVHATAQVPWRSSGWNVDRNVRMMLECLLGPGRGGDQRTPGQPAPVGPRRAGLPRGPAAVPRDEAGDP